MIQLYDRIHNGHVCEILNKKEVMFMWDKAEYGVDIQKISTLIRKKETCDICNKIKFVKVFVRYNCGADVIYLCNDCLKRCPEIKELVYNIQYKSFSYRGIESEARKLGIIK
ncbi:MAG: hypothetical protein V1901_04010 [Patescibacteria group bacterium]